MKTARKTLLLALAVMMMVGATVLGTLAYLTSRDSVTNTFTVGNVNITVDEADVDEDGKVVSDERVDGNEYHLIPGQTYTKDPTMTVKANSEDSYVRMMVTINCLSELKDILGDNFLPQDYVTGWDANVWSCVAVKENTADNEVTYEFRYVPDNGIVKQSTSDQVLDALFDSFTLPGKVTGEQLETIQGLKITAIGHAIQSATFADDDAAWAAFDDQYA